MSKNSWHTLVFRVASQVNLRCGFWVHKPTDMEIIIVVYEHLMAIRGMSEG